jgi:hypothetical protein
VLPYHYPRCRQRSTSHETPGHFTLLAIEMCCVYCKTVASFQQYPRIRHQCHGPISLLEYSVSFQWMVEQNDTSDHTIVSRFTIQCQGLQPAVSRVWKVESATTGRLLRRESCVPAEKWSRIDVEAPFFSGERKGPHLTTFCEGCRNGRCNGGTANR